MRPHRRSAVCRVSAFVHAFLSAVRTAVCGTVQDMEKKGRKERREGNICQQKGKIEQNDQKMVQ